VTEERYEAVLGVADDLRREIGDLRRRRKEIEEQLADRESELLGVNAWLERHAPDVDPDSPLGEVGAIPPDARDRYWQELQRTDAVLEALLILNRPSSPTEIQELLHDVGRDDEYNVVSAALAYLKRKGVVESRRRGAWVPAGSEGLVLEDDEGNTLAVESTLDVENIVSADGGA
jgi:hypothetical protein